MATAEEAEERSIQMLNLYADFCEEVLAIPGDQRKEDRKGEICRSRGYLYD